MNCNESREYLSNLLSFVWSFVAKFYETAKNMVLCWMSSLYRVFFIGVGSLVSSGKNMEKQNILEYLWYIE